MTTVTGKWKLWLARTCYLLNFVALAWYSKQRLCAIANMQFMETVACMYGSVVHMSTGNHMLVLKLKSGSQYDAGPSVALRYSSVGMQIDVA